MLQTAEDRPQDLQLLQACQDKDQGDHPQANPFASHPGGKKLLGQGDQDPEEEEEPEEGKNLERMTRQFGSQGQPHFEPQVEQQQSPERPHRGLQYREGDGQGTGSGNVRYIPIPLKSPAADPSGKIGNDGDHQQKGHVSDPILAGPKMQFPQG